MAKNFCTMAYFVTIQYFFLAPQANLDINNKNDVYFTGE